MTFEQFEQRCAANAPKFSINESHWAAECTILPTLLIIIAMNGLIL